MILSQIKTAVALYHRRTSSDLTQNGLDMFLVAANNARRNAEMVNDFESTKVTATLTIDGSSGADLGNAVIAGSTVDELTDGVQNYLRIGTWNGYPLYYVAAGTFIYYSVAEATYIQGSTLDDSPVDARILTPDDISPIGNYVGRGILNGTNVDISYFSRSLYKGIKKLIAVTATAVDGSRYPLDFRSIDSALETTRAQDAVDDPYSDQYRYASDRTPWPRGIFGCIVQQRTNLSLYPQQIQPPNENVDVEILCHAWLSDYLAADLSAEDEFDVFLKYASDYIMWSCVCELNYSFKTFVQRTEGELGSPEKNRDTALQRFVLWDQDSFATSNTFDR